MGEERRGWEERRGGGWIKIIPGNIYDLLTSVALAH